MAVSPRLNILDWIDTSAAASKNTTLIKKWSKVIQKQKSHEFYQGEPGLPDTIMRNWPNYFQIRAKIDHFKT